MTGANISTACSARFTDFVFCIRSFSEAFQTMQPLAAMLSVKFGAVVSIMMAAPLGADGSVESIV